MNTSALKAFAPTVRRQLMEAVARKLDFVLSAQTPDYLTTFAPQVSALRKLALEDRTGLVERIAYTWFNRLAALRYLDAKGWHPFRARVLTPATADETQPELLKLTRTGSLPDELRRHTNLARLNDLLDGRIPSPDPQGEVYRHLILAACRFYNALLPNLFERLDDETELLLPDDLLTEHSIAQGFRTEICDTDCSQVEILGWLYQFYISEKKDEVMGRKAAVSPADIPAVTQLFTPHWIVRYLVENSLGRLWLLNRPASRLRERMPYYIDVETETGFQRISRPEEIRVLDPAVGSGHMLTYAFDLLYAIYEEEGYAQSDIPGRILTHNLYGIDICPRAAQLASLALVLKAREHLHGFFQADRLVHPCVLCLEALSVDDGELRDYIQTLSLGSLFNEPMLKLLHQFDSAKNVGSLIEPCLSEAEITKAYEAIEGRLPGDQLFLGETHTRVLRVLRQASMLTQSYQVVVTNPPYMGSKSFNPGVNSFVVSHFDGGRNDLYACFIRRCLGLTISGGFIGMITLPGWLFITSFEGLRKQLLSSSSIVTLIDNGRGLWGSDFGSCAFTVFTRPSSGEGKFKRLYHRSGEVNSSSDLSAAFHNSDSFKWYTVASSEFLRIAGCPIAFWLSRAFRRTFADSAPLSQFAEPRKGMVTADNPRFIRLWFEVSYKEIKRDASSRREAKESQRKWFPYQKGGDFRKWFGNLFSIVDWENDGARLLGMKNEGYKTGSTNHNLDYIFLPAIVWTKVTIAEPAFRYSQSGCLFDDASGLCVSRGDLPNEYILAFLCSRPGIEFLKAINPTVNTQPGNLAVLPLTTSASRSAVTTIAQECIAISRTDWDSFEISCDFRDLPLLRAGWKRESLGASWQCWKSHCDAALRQMQNLETENNRLFINAYGLDGELSAESHDDQITLARADERNDVAAFLSYAVGCMMGRYSLYAPGLILADAGGTLADYLARSSEAVDEPRFVPDKDGIIPFLDGEWFEEDIVARTREFLRATFGEAALRENVRFIETSLGKELRKYFLADFYKDHLQTYKKRPIYWMIQSPRKGFSVLIYLHRYTRDTMNLVLNRYLREYEAKLRNRLAHLAQVQVSEATSPRDKTTARKEADKLTKTLRECEEWERDVVLPLAQARIELDLDDGVKVNYLKLGEALAPIPGFAAVEE